MVVTFALGLHDIAVGLSSLVNKGPRYILIISRGPEQHFLTGALLCQLTGTMGLVSSETVSWRGGSSIASPCQLGLKAYWATGRSCCAGSPGKKACWA